MKAKDLIVALTTGGLALLAAPGPSLADEAPGEVRLSSFKLEESGGYEVEVSGGRIGKGRQILSVNVKDDPLVTSYSIRTVPGPRLRGTFGSLGQLNVRFERRRKQVERPEKGCRWINETGVFRGSFSFVGEEGYFSSRAVDPEGEVFRMPDGFCGLGDFRVGGIPLPGIRQTVLETSAPSEGGTISFAASQLEFRRSNSRVSFNASLRERVGEMTIDREASVNGTAATFSHSGTSQAIVAPPAPFLGSGEYNRLAAGPAWTGSLSVSFLGASERALTGETFAAKLCPHVSILSSCLRRRAPAQVRSRYGSGSHSQPLALARLSSLR